MSLKVDDLIEKLSKTLSERICHGRKHKNEKYIATEISIETLKGIISKFKPQTIKALHEAFQANKPFIISILDFSHIELNYIYFVYFLDIVSCILNNGAIEKLSFHEFRFPSDSFFLELVKVLLKSSHFNSLVFSGMRVGSKEFVSGVMSLIKNNPKLICLNLSNNKLNDQDIKEIIESIPNTSSLTECDFTENNLRGSAGFIELLKKCRHLEVLNLKGIQLGTEGLRVLSENIPKECNVAELNFSCVEMKTKSDLESVVTIIEKSSKLRRLNLGYTKFGDKGIQLLEGALPKQFGLNYLSLSSASVTYESVESLVGLVQKNPNLEVLSLSNCELTADAFYTFVQKIPDNCRLIEINLRQCFLNFIYASSDPDMISKAVSAITLLFKKAPRLQTLILYGVALRDAGIQALSQLMSTCSLKKLSLRKTGLGTKSHSAIVTLLAKCPNLDALDLGENPDLCLHEAKPFLELSKHENLTFLNLESCGLNAESIPGLAEFLKMPKLSSINLSGNELRDNGVLEFSKLLYRNQYLTSLNLSSNGMSSKDLEMVLEVFTHNNTLLSLNVDDSLWFLDEESKPIDILRKIENNLKRNALGVIKSRDETPKECKDTKDNKGSTAGQNQEQKETKGDAEASNTSRMVGQMDRTAKAVTFSKPNTVSGTNTLSNLNNRFGSQTIGKRNSPKPKHSS